MCYSPEPLFFSFLSPAPLRWSFVGDDITCTSKNDRSFWNHPGSLLVFAAGLCLWGGTVSSAQTWIQPEKSQGQWFIHLPSQTGQIMMAIRMMIIKITIIKTKKSHLLMPLPPWIKASRTTLQHRMDRKNIPNLSLWRTRNTKPLTRREPKKLPGEESNFLHVSLAHWCCITA